MPSFSSDGKQITFVSTRDGDHEIYTPDLGHGGKPGKPRRITQSPGFDTHPVYSPDGKWLVFSSQRGGLNDEEPLIPVFNPQPYGDLYVIRLDDGLVVRLTHNKWEGRNPDLGRASAWTLTLNFSRLVDDAVIIEYKLKRKN